MISTEKHVAQVSNNQDPQKRGRIKVVCASVMGDGATELPQWIEPDFEWGWFSVPDVGEFVDIEHTDSADDDESPGQSSIHVPNFRWKGRHWGGTDTDVPRPVPDDFTKTNYAKRRGFATPGGHVIMFDDTEGSKKVSITWHGKDKEFSYSAWDEDGSVIHANKNGSLIYLNAKDKELSIVDEHGNSALMSDTGITLTDKFSNVYESKDGATQILNQGSVTVSCKNATIDAGKIELTAGATEAVLKGDSFLQLFEAHIHPTGMGPSGPPVAAAQYEATKSTKVFTG
jgi:hypothetical protein